MNLALLLFRKDVRLFRYPLALLAGLLVIDLMVSQGWFGRTRWEWPFDYTNLTALWYSWLIMFTVGDALIITGGSVFADAPSRENAFLRTRPMPAASIWIGKALFLGGCVVLPLVLVESVNLKLHGLPSAIVWAGTMERLTLVLPIVAIIFCLAATPNNRKSMVALIAGGYVVGVVGIGLIAALAHAFTETFAFDGESSSPDYVSVRCGLLLVAALLVAYSWWAVRFRPGNRLRWVFFMVIILVGEWAVVMGPHNPQLRGSAQAEVTKAVAAAAVALPINGIVPARNDDSTDTVRLGWSLLPEFKGLPEGWFIRWGGCSAELRTGDARVYRANPYRGRTLVFRRQYNLTADEMNSIAGLLPKGTIIESQPSYHRGRPMSYPPFDLPPEGDWWQQPADLKVAGVGYAYAWELATELPLTVGAHAQVGDAEWRIVAKHVDDGQSLITLIVECESVGLAISVDQNMCKGGRWPADRYEFLVHDPVNRIARGSDHRNSSSDTVGGHTGFQRRTVILSMNEAEIVQKGWRENPEQLRLLIFKLNYLGNFRHTEEIALVPGDHRGRSGSGSNLKTDRITKEEYRRRFDSLAKPAPDASRAVVGNHMHSLLQLVAAYRNYDESDLAIRALVELVPQHLDLFIDGMEVADSYPRRALDVAVRMGVTEAQKEKLISRLRDHPELAGVIMDRGWQEAARDELFALIDRRKKLPVDALRALAWFADSRADARLIAELHNGSPEDVYRILARLPRFAEPLDRAVREMWAERPRFYQPHSGHEALIYLAIRHGIPEAVRETVRVLRLYNREQHAFDFRALMLLGEMVELPGITSRDRVDQNKIRAAALALGDSDFDFDPVFRRYRPLKGADQ